MSCYSDHLPIIVERGEGNYLYDVDGNRYLDAISSLWVNTLGHSVPELRQAAVDQLDRVAHSTLLGNGNRTTVEFAERLAPALPVPDPHILFAGDGASATEQALKIAFQYWHNQGVTDRTAYLALGGAYHGDTIGSLSIGGGGFGTTIFDPLRFPVERTPGYADPDWAAQAIAALEEHHEHLAALMFEPLVQGAAGILVSRPDDVGRVVDAAQAHHVPVICDEVATGFGRTGTLFASEQCGIQPDIVCVGKAITGGYLALAGTAVAPHIYEAFLGPDLSDKTLYHGHSYSGNALACAVALAHLDLIERGSILQGVATTSARLAERLVAIDRRPEVAEVRQCGLMVGIELDGPDDGRWGRRVCAAAVRRGVLLRPLGDVIVVMPPLSITPDEIERIVDTVDAAITEVAA